MTADNDERGDRFRFHATKRRTLSEYETRHLVIDEAGFRAGRGKYFFTAECALPFQVHEVEPVLGPSAATCPLCIEVAAVQGHLTRDEFIELVTAIEARHNRWVERLRDGMQSALAKAGTA